MAIDSSLLSGMGIVALSLIVVAAVKWGRKEVETTYREKRTVLRSLEGQDVTLAIGTRFIIRQTGKVVVTDDSFAVEFRDGATRLLPLAEIRWIDGPNGQRVGGPW